MGFDNNPGVAYGAGNENYIVIQVVLTEKLLGSGSGTASLTNLQAVINKQAAKGYRLHTISTTSSGTKGFLGGDKIQATMVFEKIEPYYPARNLNNTNIVTDWRCTNCNANNNSSSDFCTTCGSRKN